MKPINEPIYDFFISFKISKILYIEKILIKTLNIEEN